MAMLGVSSTRRIGAEVALSGGDLWVAAVGIRPDT
jgi:hypothetical protein